MASYSSTSPPSPTSARTQVGESSSPAKLGGNRSQNNYSSWRKQMLRLAESQGLVGFIDGTNQPPNDVGEQTRTDWLVKVWIQGALSDEVLQNVAHLDSARDVWLELEKDFSVEQEIQQAQDGFEINVKNFVSSKLSGDMNRNNYITWKEQMLGLIESQGLVGFVDSKATRPPQANDDVEWRQTDWLVKGLILRALSDEIVQKVVHLHSAMEIWLMLEKEFSTTHSNYPPPPPPSDYLPPPTFTGQPPGATPHEWGPTIDILNFVPSKLSRLSDWSSYKLWKEGMLRLVQSQGLVGYLDTIAHPPRNDDIGYNSWMQSNGKVKGWILEALTEEVAQHVAHLDRAKDVWTELENESFSSKPSRQEENQSHEELEFYKVAMNGDWNRAQVILKHNPDIIRLRMSLTEETALHVAVGSNKSASFVEELVKSCDDYTLSMQDRLGYNAMHAAARTGNHRAIQILVRRHPDLLYVSCQGNIFPLHLAAEFGHRETLELLMYHTRDDLPVNPFAGQSGLLLMGYCITANFLDIAVDLVNKYPYLVRMRSHVFGSALSCIAVKVTTFAAQSQLINISERLLYSCIQLDMEYSLLVQSFDDIESQNIGQPPRWRKQIQKLHSTLWEYISELVPCVKRIREKKWMREQALRLVRSICKHMKSLQHERASAIYLQPLLKAAEVGNHELVEEIIGTFPLAIYSSDVSTEQGFMHMAVRNRCEKVFNLLYQTNNHRFTYVNRCDRSGNSILHIVGYMAPFHKLNLVSGAALQMQREIQWFKEVSKVVIPSLKERPNNAGQTPAMIFTAEHRNLKVEGEKWMKDTANSCTIAAAITVPGGNQSENGYPMMWNSSAFTIFAVSDAISLFTSTTSLLMFLSILTSRYAEEDFLYALPKRLGIGLVTLFLSILFMMAAFSSTVYLVFGRKSAWVLIPAAALTCLPISSFVLLQFPLLIAVLSSTYGKGIFGKQSNRPFH